MDKKTELKLNHFIEGFEHEWEYRQRLYGNTGIIFIHVF